LVRSFFSGLPVVAAPLVEARSASHVKTTKSLEELTYQSRGKTSGCAAHGILPRRMQRGTNMKRSTLAIVIGVVVVAMAVTSYASPYLTLREMRTAIAEKDANAFSSHVDFPALRESVRAQVMIAMQAKLGTPEMKGNALAGLGMLLGMALINQVIDTIVTPAGVMTLMAEGTSRPLDMLPGHAPASGGAAASRSPASSVNPPSAPVPSATASGGDTGAAVPTATAPRDDYTVQYKDWSTFTATARQDGQAAVTFTFRREGLWAWKLAGVTLPFNPAP
jgi:hypothetical protein